MRGTWQYYYESVNGIIFVVDATTSSEALAEVKEKLHQVLSETENEKIPVLIFANK